MCGAGDLEKRRGLLGNVKGDLRVEGLFMLGHSVILWPREC